MNINKLHLLICGIILATVLVENQSKSIKSSVKRSDVGFNDQGTTTNFTTLINDLKKLRIKRSKEEIKQIATLGLVSGALRVERNMREHLADLMKDFYMSFNTSTREVNMEKLLYLEETMERDKRAIQILSSILDFARNSLSYEEYRSQMERISKDSEIALLKLSKKRFSQQLSTTENNNQTIENIIKNAMPIKLELDKTLKSVKTMVEHHINEVHSTVKSKVKQTLKYLKNQNQKAVKNKPDFDEIPNKMLENSIKNPPSESIKSPTLNRKIGIDFFKRTKRQGDSGEKEELDNEIISNESRDKKRQTAEDENASQESESESSEEQGGLLGLIAGLSGGDEGSDIGALLGALTGVVTNLFGPGGLDIPSLLSTATSLISGLLAGDENFGKVLAGYITTSVDGLSGGGGAELNGQFFGQFLGTLISGLSADPEDEDLPPRPEIFIKNVFAGSQLAKNKAGKGGAEDAEGGGDGKGGGSDLFGFIGNVVSSIVGGVTNIIVNAVLGTSGGSSQGSAGLSAGSSGSSSHKDMSECQKC